MCTARRRSRPVRRLRSVWGGWAYAYVHGVSVNGVCDKCTINFVTDRRQQANMQPQIVDILPPRVRHAVRGAGRAPLQSRPVGRRVSAGRTASIADSCACLRPAPLTRWRPCRVPCGVGRVGRVCCVGEPAASRLRQLPRHGASAGGIPKNGGMGCGPCRACDRVPLPPWRPPSVREGAHPRIGCACVKAWEAA
jgi:hypothetical protein